MSAITLAEAEALVAESFRDRRYRPTVVAVVTNVRGRILVVQSAKDPSVWHLPQGGIDEGETALSALYRELRDKTGIVGHDLMVRGLISVEDIDAPGDRRDKRWFTHGKRYVAMRVTYSGVAPLSIDGVELAGYDWLSVANLATRIAPVRPEKRDYMLRLIGTER